MRRSPGPAALVAVASTVVLVACGSGSAEPAPDGGRGDAAVAADVLAGENAHNDVDGAFLRDMIPHHEQGLELSDLVPARSPTPAVRDIAALIDRQQGAEIGQLRGMLRSWNLPAPPSAPGSDMPMTGTSTGGMSMGATSMPGMATPDTLNRLRTAAGPEFDRLWLQAMIRHHEGAVTMARTQLDGGVSRGARNTAQNVISVQQAQIATMRTLLDVS